MANARLGWFVSSTLVWLLVAVAQPASAGEASLAQAEPPGAALSDDDMARLRGGFLGLPPGSSAFLQIGQQTAGKQQAGTPSSASASLSSATESLSGSASLGGPAAHRPTLAVGSLSQIYSLTTTHSFSVSAISGL